MFAIVNIAGQQFKVTENSKHYVPLLHADVESELTFDEVLLLADENGTKVGAPNVEGLKVYAKVLQHTQDDKVIVFKKKIRIGYRRLKGHRQDLTQIQITKIGK
jgi:large subunit ribosomal protein L21